MTTPKVQYDPISRAPRLVVAVARAASAPPARGSRAREQLMRSHVHYLGFRITEAGREYTLRDTSQTPRLFVMTIPHQHFASGQARYQDGPGLCCAKLTRLLIDEDPGEVDHEVPLTLTARELLEYRTAASPSSHKRARRDAGAAGRS